MHLTLLHCSLAVSFEEKLKAWEPTETAESSQERSRRFVCRCHSAWKESASAASSYVSLGLLSSRLTHWLDFLPIGAMAISTIGQRAQTPFAGNERQEDAGRECFEVERFVCILL